MSGKPLTNWAGNVVFDAAEVRAPASLAELCELVASATRVRAAGARHSFSEVAQTDGTLLDMRRLDALEPPDDRGLVRVGAGAAYGDVCAFLARHRRALPNLASLPHVTVGGAVATATHGSGARQPSLASAVRALEVVDADGQVTTTEAGDGTFEGRVVSLGALGVVSAVTLATVPEVELRQHVYLDLPWAALDGDGLASLLRTGYSTSLFTRWAEPAVAQVWVKTAEAAPPDVPARRATGPTHPIAGAAPANCTEQLGVPGPSAERLPHFRYAGVPSAGDELQSEYAVAAPDAPAALAALRAIGDAVAPHLHVSEIRAVAADRLWLSPFHGRDSVAFHFTWKREPGAFEAIPRVEAALRPFEPRPHWGKLFAHDAAYLRRVHPRLGDFLALRRELDPAGKFENAFVRSLG